MNVDFLAQATLESAPGDGAPRLRCDGAWTVRGIVAVERELARASWPGSGEVVIDGSGISMLDTAGAWVLYRTRGGLEASGHAVRVEGLRPEFDSLLGLIGSKDLPREIVAAPRVPWLVGVGQRSWAVLGGGVGYLAFVGESFVALLRVLREPHRLRWRAILHNVQTAGVEALPITGLLSFLMGVVIAYQGADQLQRFGANIFIADLVGISMLRELSPLLTAIIIAGRSGSAYTAQIGTMKVTEEIDALRTIGVPPLELLVLPKMIALVVVMPLLTVYTDVTGVLGGMIMAQWKLDVGLRAFVDRLDDAIVLSTYWTGLAKAPVFAMIVALVGCHRGFMVTGSADSVGTQTTMSVVQSIFLVIVTDAVFSVVFLWLDL
jgi:phospholipid/cholesterol/gamma-HCH transport system permease protein